MARFVIEPACHHELYPDISTAASTCSGCAISDNCHRQNTELLVSLIGRMVSGFPGESETDIGARVHQPLLHAQSHMATIPPIPPLPVGSPPHSRSNMVGHGSVTDAWHGGFASSRSAAWLLASSLWTRGASVTACVALQPCEYTMHHPMIAATPTPPITFISVLISPILSSRSLR